jgi:hypothetical protein
MSNSKFNKIRSSGGSAFSPNTISKAVSVSSNDPILTTRFNFTLDHANSTTTTTKQYFANLNIPNLSFIISSSINDNSTISPGNMNEYKLFLSEDKNGTSDDAIEPLTGNTLGSVINAGKSAIDRILINDHKFIMLDVSDIDTSDPTKNDSGIISVELVYISSS